MNISEIADNSQSLISFFDRRKASFLTSLQHILAAVTSDLFIQQMFEDPASSLYIPDRVCELIRKYLNDDRESALKELTIRIKAMEACLGLEKYQKIEEIGRKIINALDANVDPKEASVIYQQQLEEVLEQGQGVVSKSRLLKISQYVDQMKDFISFMREFYIEFLQYIHSSLILTKSSIKKSINPFIALINEYKLREVQYKNQIEEMTRRYTKVDIPKLKQHFEEELERHIKNEENLQKSLNRVKRALLKLSTEHSKALDELNSLKTEVARNRSVLAEFEQVQNSKAELEGILSSLKKELSSKNKTIENLLNDSQISSQQNTTLQSTIATSKKDIIDKDNEIQKLKDTIIKMQRALDDKNNENSLIDADLQMLKTKLSIIPSIEAERDEALEKFTTLENEHLMLSTSYTELKEKIAKVIEEKTKIYDEANQSLQNQFAELNEKTIETSKQNTLLNSELSRLQESIQEQSNIISKLEIDKKELIANSTKQQKMIKERENALTILKNQYSAILKQNDEVRSQISTINEKSAELSSNLQLSQQNLRKRDHEIKEIRYEKEKVDNECKELQKQIAQALQESKNAQTSISQTNESLLFIQDELKKKNLIIDQLMKAEQTQKDERDKLSKVVDSLHLEIKQNASDKTERDKKIKMLTQQIEAFQVQNESLVDSVQKYDAKFRQVIESKTKIEKQNKELRNEIKQRQSDKEILEDNIKILQAKLTKLKTDLRDSYNNKEGVEKARNQLLNEKKLIQEQYLEEKKKHIDEISEYQGKLESAIQEVERYKDEIEQLNLKISDLTNHISNKDNEFGLEKEKNSNELENIKKQYESLQSKYSDLKEKHKTFNDTVKSVEDNIKNIFQFEEITQIPDIISKLNNDNEVMNNLINSLNLLVDNDEENDKNFENEEEDKGPANNNKKIFDYFQKLKSRFYLMKEREKILLTILPEANSPEDLYSCIKHKKNDLEDLQLLFEKIMKIINETNQNIVPKTINKMMSSVQKYKEIKQSIKNLLPNLHFKNLPDRIKGIQDRLISYEQQEKQLLSVFEHSNPSNLVNSITKLRDRANQLEEMNNGIKAIITDSTDDDILEDISKIKNELTKLQNEQNEIRENLSGKYYDKELPEAIHLLSSDYDKLNEEYKSITDQLNCDDELLSNKISQTLDDLNKLTHFKESLKLLLGDDDVEKKIKLIMHLCDTYETQTRTIESLIPNEFEGTLPQRVTKLTQMRTSLQNEQNQILKFLSKYSSSSTAVGKVNEIIKQFNELANQQDLIEKSIPEEIKNAYRESDLVRKVRILSQKYLDQIDKHDEINHILPEGIDGDDISEKFSRLVSKYNNLLRKESRINKIIPSEFVDSKNDNLENQITSLVEKQREANQQRNNLTFNANLIWK